MRVTLTDALTQLSRLLQERRDADLYNDIEFVWRLGTLRWSVMITHGPAAPSYTTTSGGYVKSVP